MKSHCQPLALPLREQAIDYRLVVIELDEAEAEAANWRACFYKVDFSPTEVVRKLGKPNATLNS
jgi:hypothetical protein